MSSFGDQYTPMFTYKIEICGLSSRTFRGGKVGQIVLENLNLITMIIMGMVIVTYFCSAYSSESYRGCVRHLVPQVFLDPEGRPVPCSGTNSPPPPPGFESFSIVRILDIILHRNTTFGSLSCKHRLSDSQRRARPRRFLEISASLSSNRLFHGTILAGAPVASRCGKVSQQGMVGSFPLYDRCLSRRTRREQARGHALVILRRQGAAATWSWCSTVFHICVGKRDDHGREDARIQHVPGRNRSKISA